jgi:hypothetical protein
MQNTPQQPTIAVTTGLLPGQTIPAANVGAGTFTGAFTFASPPTMSGANILAGTVATSATDLQWINARDPVYGVVGNGVANDTAALNLAAVAAQTAGWPLYIPPGTYLMSGPLLVYTSGTRIFGAGRGLTTLKMTAGFAAQAGALNGSSGLIELTSASAGDYSALNDVSVSDMTFDCTLGVGLISAQHFFSIHQSFRLINRLRIERLVLLNASYAGGIMLEQICSGSSSATIGQDILIQDIHAENGPYSVGIYCNASNTSGTSVFSNITVERIQDYINLPITDDRVLLAVHCNGQSGVATGLSVYNCIVRDVNTRIDAGAVAASSLVNGIKYDVGSAYLNDILIDGCNYAGTPTATITGTMAGGLTYNGTGFPVIYLTDGHDKVGFVTVRNCTAQYAAQYRVGANPPTQGAKVVMDNLGHQNCLAPLGMIELFNAATGTTNDVVVITNCTGVTSVASQGNGFPAHVAYTPQGSSQGFNGTFKIENLFSNGFQTGILAGFNDSQTAITGTLFGYGAEIRNVSGVLSSALFAGLGAAAPLWAFRDCPPSTPFLGSAGNIGGVNNPVSGTKYQNTLNYDVLVTITNTLADITAVGLGKTSGGTFYNILPGGAALPASTPISAIVKAGTYINVTYTGGTTTWICMAL